MNISLDIETDGINPTIIWCCVCTDIDTGDSYVHYNRDSLSRFLAGDVSLIIGHNCIAYDIYYLKVLWGINIPRELVRDTLVLSRLLDYRREGGHSLESWGETLGFSKGTFSDFSQLSKEMVEYCIRDTQVNVKIWHYLVARFKEGNWWKPIDTEHKVAWLCRDAQDYGFFFDRSTANDLYKEISLLCSELDAQIKAEFKPVKKLDREYKVRFKKDGTYSATTLRLLEDPNSTLDGDTIYKYYWEEFNPQSSRQIIERLHDHWEPQDKTDGHKDNKDRNRREYFNYYGWKINETNLETLKETAPSAAQYLVKRILLGARLRQLESWLKELHEDDYIRSNLNSIGTWTHRLSSTKPNIQNIAAKKTIKYKSKELRDIAIDYGGRFRSLFQATPGNILVGTDMEGAHLRLFAHFINDKQFIQALVSGRKEDGTDPHSLNKKIIGSLCPDRDLAKTFIFSFLNGAGSTKIAEIFKCDSGEASSVLRSFIEAYPGLQHLKEVVFPKDVERGYFIGLDGRRIPIDSEHLAMAGYLQNGEAVIVKTVAVNCKEYINRNKLPVRLMNIVHDEILFDCHPDYAEHIGKYSSEEFKKVGEQFKLNCPLSGEYKQGKTWLDAH